MWPLQPSQLGQNIDRYRVNSFGIFSLIDRPTLLEIMASEPRVIGPRDPRLHVECTVPAHHALISTTIGAVSVPKAAYIQLMRDHYEQNIEREREAFRNGLLRGGRTSGPPSSSMHLHVDPPHWMSISETHHIMESVERQISDAQLAAGIQPTTDLDEESEGEEEVEVEAELEEEEKNEEEEEGEQPAKRARLAPPPSLHEPE